MRLRRTVAIGLAAVACVAVTAGRSRPPERLTFDFAATTGGWQAIPPPTGPDVALALTDDPPARRSLRLRYRVAPKKLAGIIRQVSGLTGGGIRLRLRTDTPTAVVVGCIERDGSSYMRVVQTVGGRWTTFEAPFSAFVLSDDSKDENGRLDLDQVGTVVIADAAGMMPTASVDQTLLLDDIELGADVRGGGDRPYDPLLPAGPASPTGARATQGVRYVAGRFGRAAVMDRPGAQMIVPVRPGPRRADWRWSQGAIEFRARPSVALAAIPDYSGLLSLQQEPFMPGFRGSLQLILTGSHQLAFMLNGATETMAPTLPLSWPAGEWRHVAITWGPAGMRIYLDGREAGRSAHTGGPAAPAADLVVGNHSWTMLTRCPAMMAMDDLRVSARQRSDAEILADARSMSPAVRDADTVALEPFDGDPAPPAAITGGEGAWHDFPAGASVAVRVAPAAVGARFRLTTAGGAAVAAGEVRGGVARMGALRDPGFYRLTAGTGTDWIRVVDGPTGAPGDRFFSASACYAQSQDSERFFRLAAQAGVRSLRMAFEWSEIEPAEGRFEWSKYDRIVKWADRFGVELVPTFIWEKAQPAWAGPGEAKAGFNSERWPPTNMARWSRFVTAVVARYRRSIRWWIPANEPNLARYWHPRPDPAAYTELLRVTREAARRADPQSKMLGLSVSGVDLTFMEACFKAGALRYCDAVGIHPYICPHDPDERLPISIMDPGAPAGAWRDALRAAGALIRRFGGRQQLWLDEAGQPYRDDFIAPDWGRPEPEAAATLAKEMIEARSSGCVDRVLWFSFFGGEYGSFALVRPDGSGTLPLAAFCAARRFFSGAIPAGDGDRGPGARSRLFRTPAGRLEAVWRAEGAGGITPRAGERAFDCFGFPIRSRTIPLGRAPVYLLRR